MLRAVFDTNVLVSGTVHAGRSRLLIDGVLEGKISLLVSAQIVQEFKRVVARDKFKLSKKQQDTLTSFVLRIATITMVKSRFKVVKDDLNDDMILRTAFDGKADYVVSGDEHLLSLKEFRGIRIVAVNEMLAFLV